jgi:hypothetical protein
MGRTSGSMLARDEARRIAVNIAKLPIPLRDDRHDLITTITHSWCRYRRLPLLLFGPKDFASRRIHEMKPLTTGANDGLIGVI